MVLLVRFCAAAYVTTDVILLYEKTINTYKGATANDMITATTITPRVICIGLRIEAKMFVRRNSILSR